MNCRLCNSNVTLVGTTQVLHRYSVKYFQCSQCQLVQTEDPYWLDEAYSSPINASDTGILARNLYFVRKISSLCFFLFDQNGKYLDFAGGFGFFTRLMRDVGFDFYWLDPFTSNLVARGFEGRKGENYELVTAFECFEHFQHPMREIENLLSFSPNVVFSTLLYPIPLPNLNDWWYYSPHHGQHIAFYSYQTLNFIASRLQLHFYSNGSDIHLFTKRKLDSRLIKIMLGPLSRFAFLYVKRRMSPRTEADMHSLESFKSPS